MLRVTGRRADGYHLLQTAIQFINLCDELAFYERPTGVIERVAGPADISEDVDLAIRAARLLAKESGVRDGVGIELRKHVAWHTDTMVAGPMSIADYLRRIGQ